MSTRWLTEVRRNHDGGVCGRGIMGVQPTTRPESPPPDACMLKYVRRGAEGGMMRGMRWESRDSESSV